MLSLHAISLDEKKKKEKKNWEEIRAHLIHVFKRMFSVFKHYMHFHTFFHSHVFLKNINNITRTTLPNGLLISESY